MQQYVGLDVSMEETAVCVVDADGRVVARGRVASQPEAIAAFVAAEAPSVVRLVLETGPLATWLYHELRGLDLPVVCVDARHAKGALSLRLNKTDPLDAEGLAQLARVGWDKAVHVKGLDCHAVRALLKSRAGLVVIRRSLEMQMRGQLKTFGAVVGKGVGRGFERRIAALTADRPDLARLVAPQMAVRRAVCEEIAGLDATLQRLAIRSPVCRRLTTVPGVGPLTALAFASAVDDAARFATSARLGAYFGLTPRRYASGEVDRTGRISKRGDPMVRHLLYEAAGVLLTRTKAPSRLKAWGLRIAARAGAKKARVAVARKLAVILHRIWITGTPFRAGAPTPQAAA